MSFTDDFIAKITPAAKATQARTGIPASFTVAQAALESNWGRSWLAVDACNLFGVKADSSWTGDVFLLPTTEYVSGKPVTVDARWRKYAGWQECLDDHAKFLLENHRYQAAFQTTTGEDFAKAVAAAGYATDPVYADKLISVMRAHNLAALDVPNSGTNVPDPGTSEVPMAQDYNPVQDMPDPTTPAPSVASIATAAAPILSMINPLLGVAAQAIPQIASIFTDKNSTVPERNIKAASAVLTTIQSAVGAATQAQGVAKIVDDPQARAQAIEALRPLLEVVEVSGGVQGARDFATKLDTSKPFYESAIVWVSVVFLIPVFMLLTDVFYVHPTLYEGNLRTQIVTAILAIISLVGAVWFGSTISSKSKDSTIQALSQK